MTDPRVAHILRKTQQVPASGAPTHFWLLMLGLIGGGLWEGANGNGLASGLGLGLALVLLHSAVLVLPRKPAAKRLPVL